MATTTIIIFIIIITVIIIIIICCVTLKVVVKRLLQCCQQYVLSKRSNLTHWHPVLGWFAEKTDPRYNLFVYFLLKLCRLYVMSESAAVF